MPTIKHKGPGLNTIGKGIQTSIIIGKDDLNELWPGFHVMDETPESETFLKQLMEWVRTERRYSLLQGSMHFIDMPFKTILYFDVSGQVIKLRLHNGKRLIFDVDIDDEELQSLEDISFTENYLDNNIMIEYLNKTHFRDDNNLLQSAEEERRLLMKMRDKTINVTRLKYKARMFTREQMHERLSIINHWYNFAINESNVNDPIPETLEGEDPEVSRIRSTFLTIKQFLHNTEQLVDISSYRLVLHSYVFVMSMMRRFVSNPPQEVAGTTKDKIIGDHGISTTYKYNGVVNVMDNRILKLNTTASEQREFVRHIGRWLVRGHWRTYKSDGRKIWIDQYEKGKHGEPLEDRIYVSLAK